MEKAKQIPYRAIALDLDGTLTNHEKVVTPKTREALLKAASEGAVIILASGRPTYGIEPVAECLELQKRGGYILSYNGGNIVNAQTGEKLFTQFLPDEVIPILYKYAREKNHALLGYAGNEIITEMPDDQYVKEESRINKMNIRKVENLLEALEPHPTKLLMTGDPSDMLKAEQELLDVVGDKMDVFRSAPFFLELVPKGIDKAQSRWHLDQPREGGYPENPRSLAQGSQRGSRHHPGFRSPYLRHRAGGRMPGTTEARGLYPFL
mgnify:CR=1 FL=1